MKDIRWILKSINESPIMAALLGCGAFFLLYGVVLNVALVQPPDVQRKVWFLDLAGEGWGPVLAGILGWMTALAAYHAWNLRQLFVVICVAGQAYLLQDVSRLWAMAALAGIVVLAIDFAESD